MTTHPRGATPERYGSVTVLRAHNGGGYPYGNPMVVSGRDSSVLIDTSLALDPDDLPSVDAVLLSHAHEDHLAGLGLFAVPVQVHDGDLAAVRSRDTLLAGYGLPAPAAEVFGRRLDSLFGVIGRPDAIGFADAARFELGGRTVTAVHLPGHTAGHCGFLVEPDGFFFVGDIDLTSFGPFYGDVGSDLEQFEASLRVCEQVDARWFGTFHQKGVLTGRADFLAALRRYRAVITARDAALLDLLGEPRTVPDIVRRRLVYRPHVDEPYVDTVETRTAEQHLQRLVRTGAAVELEAGLFRRAER